MMDKNVRIIRLLPVLLFTSLIPLLVRALPYTATDREGGGNAAELWDVFSLVKSRAILAVAAFAFLVFIFLFISKKITVKRTIVYIPMAAYVICVIISCLLSEYRETAWAGGMNRFEGTGTILCYIFMLFYTIQAVENEEDVRLVMRWILVMTGIQCIIGLTQFAGHDILFSPMLSGIISGGMEMKPSFFPGQVYQTVANMNYVPFYLALVVPYVIWEMIKTLRDIRHISRVGSAVRVDKAVGRAGYLLLLILIVINCIGAGSVGGVLGILVSLAVLMILSLKDRRVRIAAMAAGVGVFAVLCVVLFVRHSDGPVPENIVTEGDRITVYAGEDRIHLAAGEGESVLPRCFDDEGHEYELCLIDGEDNIYRINDADFEEHLTLEPLAYEGERYLVITVSHQQLLFHLGEGKALFCDPHGEETELRYYDRGVFRDHMSLGNGRGFIWNAALSLIREHPLFGGGADTFRLLFPQEDYVGKVASGGNVHTVIDKAHNMYIQMAVTTGLPSLMAFVCMIIMIMGPVWRMLPGGYMLTGRDMPESSGRNGVPQKGSTPSADDTMLPAVLAAGIAGFLTGALTCDSTVSVMPIFYGVLGCAGALSVSGVRFPMQRY